VIGVYEPAAVVGAGEVQIASRAVAPLGVSGDELYHLACYEIAGGKTAAAPPRRIANG
jgi:hypothetical protein